MRGKGCFLKGGGEWQVSESDGEEEKVKFFQTEEGVSLKRPAPLDTTQTIWRHRSPDSVT